MRCGFPGVGSNPRNGYIRLNCNYLFLFFSLSFLLSAGVCFKCCMFIFIYLATTPFWYHSFKKTKTLCFFVDYLFFVFCCCCCCCCFLFFFCFCFLFFFTDTCTCTYTSCLSYPWYQGLAATSACGSSWNFLFTFFLFKTCNVQFFIFSYDDLDLC